MLHNFWKEKKSSIPFLITLDVFNNPTYLKNEKLHKNTLQAVQNHESTTSLHTKSAGEWGIEKKVILGITVGKKIISELIHFLMYHHSEKKIILGIKLLKQKLHHLN